MPDSENFLTNSRGRNVTLDQGVSFITSHVAEAVTVRECHLGDVYLFDGWPHHWDSPFNIWEDVEAYSWRHR
jgi:hypothetical protein